MTELYICIPKKSIAPNTLQEIRTPLYLQYFEKSEYLTKSTAWSANSYFVNPKDFHV